MGIDNHTSESINHLVQLNKYLNSGFVLEAGKDWLSGEIAQMEQDLGILSEEVQAV